jgi:hypothetical protein
MQCKVTALRMDKRACGFALALAAGDVAPAFGQDSAGPFAGKSIVASVDIASRIRRPDGHEFDSTVKWGVNVSISAGGQVKGSGLRTGSTSRGKPVSRTYTISGKVGKPRRGASGHNLMFVSGNTLTMLSTFDVGGSKTTITLQGGSRCAISFQSMREVGAGATRRDAIGGGSVQILRARQTGSSCSVR